MEANIFLSLEVLMVCACVCVCAALLLITVVELASPKYDTRARLVNMFVSPQEVLMLEDMLLIPIANNSTVRF